MCLSRRAAVTASHTPRQPPLCANARICRTSGDMPAMQERGEVAAGAPFAGDCGCALVTDTAASSAVASNELDRAWACCLRLIHERGGSCAAGTGSGESGMLPSAYTLLRMLLHVTLSLHPSAAGFRACGSWAAVTSATGGVAGTAMRAHLRKRNNGAVGAGRHCRLHVHAARAHRIHGGTSRLVQRSIWQQRRCEQ